MKLQKRLSTDPVGSQERADIEKDTAISFAGKGMPMFTRSKKKEDEKPVAQDQDIVPDRMAEGIRSSYVDAPKRGGYDKFGKNERGGRDNRGRGDRDMQRGGNRGGRGRGNDREETK